MFEHVVGIQPAVLRWARERSGHTLEQVADAMGKDLRLIKAWEKGDEAPTYIQLEKLAYQIYKRPIALFFFPEPPQEADPKKSFRTLPESEFTTLGSDTLYVLRYAQAMQLALKELNDGANPSEKKIFADIKLKSSANVAKAAAHVREYLDITLDEQTEWHTDDQALKSWRQHVEAAGVFVFKRSFKQKSISGFCLADDEFPLIYLNNSTARTRQIFSLFHELAHVLFHVNGMTKQDDRYINYLPAAEKRIEQVCNRFACELLVPESDFHKRIRGIPRNPDDAVVSFLANRYKVSREVILRMLLDRGLTDQEHYETKAAQWNKEYLESKSESEGGNYYATQAAYLGDKYLGLIFGKYYQGRLTIEQVGDYLGVRTKSVAGLEQFFMDKAASA